MGVSDLFCFPGCLEGNLVFSGLQLSWRPSPKPLYTQATAYTPRSCALALHMLGEDLRLMIHRHDKDFRLAGLICPIASIIWPEWMKNIITDPQVPYLSTTAYLSGLRI
jgi:hypothetical protein